MVFCNIGITVFWNTKIAAFCNTKITAHTIHWYNRISNINGILQYQFLAGILKWSLFYTLIWSKDSDERDSLKNELDEKISNSNDYILHLVQEEKIMFKNAINRRKRELR